MSGGVVYLEQIGHGGVTGRVTLQHVAGMLDRIEGIGAIGRRDVRHVRFVDRIEWVDVAGTLGRASDASGTVALCSFFSNNKCTRAICAARANEQTGCCCCTVCVGW